MRKIKGPAISNAAKAAAGNPLRKVMIATPCRDGSTSVHYTNALANSVKFAMTQGIELCPWFMPGEALVQIARNELLAIMLGPNGQDFTDVVWIDDDMGWAPDFIPRLLAHDVDVVGAVCPKKSSEIGWNVRMLPTGITVNDKGLAPVHYVGTGFLRMSRKACQALWDAGEPYTRGGGPERRMAFDLAIDDQGELVSEDNLACHTLREKGLDIYIDATLTCTHTGPQTFGGDFHAWLKTLPPSGTAAAVAAASQRRVAMKNKRHRRK